MKSILIFIVLLIGSYFFNFQNQVSLSKEENDVKIRVMVEGAIKNPGEFELNNASMEDLFSKLELNENADCTCVSMERALFDKDRIYIPEKSEVKVSLNHASKEELMQIKGVGEKKAEKIIEYRNTNSFTSIEQIMEISGIGEKTYLKWRPYLCL